MPLVLNVAMQEISPSVCGDGWFNLCTLKLNSPQVCSEAAYTSHHPHTLPQTCCVRQSSCPFNSLLVLTMTFSRGTNLKPEVPVSLGLRFCTEQVWPNMPFWNKDNPALLRWRTAPIPCWRMCGSLSGQRLTAVSEGKLTFSDTYVHVFNTSVWVMVRLPGHI